MYCKIEGCGRPEEANEMCSSHNREARKAKTKELNKKAKPKIKQISEKKMKEINEYSRIKKEFMSNPENQICKVCGKPGADSIHHALRKIGYADDWARLNGISLLIDTRFFIPIHSHVINPDLGTTCHNYIENNPEFAREIGVTLIRNNRK